MTLKRKLVHTDTPEAKPGFLGRGHLARPVIQRPFAESDPFIMLMDDRLDKKDDAPAGGPHPHAGFETVSLLIEGDMAEMKAGDFQMMTAGAGVIHTETIEEPTKMRLLQLWLNLPKSDRWAIPRLQELTAAQAPSLSKDGVSIRVYSGSLAGLTSPVKNYTPLLLADIKMEAGASAVLPLAANLNTFLYVLDGGVLVGTDGALLRKDQVGWLDIFGTDARSDVVLKAGEKAVRLVLYAGRPTGDAIVSHGPFIAGSNEDILRLYNDYRQGKMEHISTIEEKHEADS